MPSSGVLSIDGLLGDGYPDKSSILVCGDPGIGKEALGYWFMRSGLVQGDYCLYVTHRPVLDVRKDMAAFGIPADRIPYWIASSGSEIPCELNDYTSISFNIKQAAQKNSNRRIRIVTDVVSPLLVLNPQPSMYQYLSSLLGELKHLDCVIMAIVEQGMHPASTIATLEQQFDGVIEMRVYEEGLSLTPLLSVKKMLGIRPMAGYFRFSFTQTGVEVIPHAK